MQESEALLCFIGRYEGRLAEHSVQALSVAAVSLSVFLIDTADLGR